ncbi:MAG: hypothetical protein RLZZ626_1155 [Actinomycetota bacterium]
MANQTMRGMRLGTQSLESEKGVAYSPRLNLVYRCGAGHDSAMVFSADAELPETWQCKSCNLQAVRIEDGQQIAIDLEEIKTPRSHWEMLLERRSREELEEILQERLAYIRARRAGGKADN